MSRKYERRLPPTGPHDEPLTVVPKKIPVSTYVSRLSRMTKRELKMETVRLHNLLMKGRKALGAWRQISTERSAAQTQAELKRELASLRADVSCYETMLQNLDEDIAAAPRMIAEWKNIILTAESHLKLVVAARDAIKYTELAARAAELCVKYNIHPDDHDESEDSDDDE